MFHFIIFHSPFSILHSPFFILHFASCPPPAPNPARWRHALWLIVLLRLAFPVLPSSSWSIFNLVRFSSAFMLRSAVPVSVLPAGISLPRVSSTVWFQPDPWGRAGDLLVAVWLLGIALVALRLLVASIRLQRRVARAGRWPELEAGLVPLLSECRAKLGIRRVVRLVVSDAVKTPALRGVLRPALLLPPNVVDGFTQRELRHVVLHELWHVRRLDVAINWILSAIQALHWFNPLVWFAVARIKEEREICCDELALSCLEEEERFSYGTTMLRLLEGFRTAAPIPALVGIVNHKQQMKRSLLAIVGG
ncbi:MAG TPA: M56 family metallopeptidase [Thermoanaerobaculia bacterium]|nr:M56 family metallopeptidase [Thermoanaerobaculia bacterium]